jgi:hypothetical protein
MNRRSCNTPTSSTPNPSFNDWVYQGLVEQKNVLIPPSVFVATTRNSNLVQSKNMFDAGRAERWRSSRGLGRSAPITSRARKPRSHSYRRTRTPNRQGQEQRVRTAEYTDVRVDACKTQKENVYYTRQWLLLHHYNEHRPFNVDSYDQTHDTSKQSVDELEHHNFGPISTWEYPISSTSPSSAAASSSISTSLKSSSSFSPSPSRFLASSLPMFRAHERAHMH